MTMSEAPQSIKNERSINEFTTAEIESSQNADDHKNNSNNQLTGPQQLRQKRRVVGIVTSTVSMTSYFFINSTVAKTYNLVGAGSSLLCIPFGYTVC